MGKLIDLTGKKIGKLTILRKASRRTKCGKLTTYYECLCDCGRFCEKSSSWIRKKKDKAYCGKCFINTVRSDTKDIIGNRYGKLVVTNIDYDKMKQNFEDHIKRRIYYMCDCDCGGHTSVRRDHLESGAIVSCGCYQSKMISEYSKQAIKTNDIIEYHDSILIKSSNSDDYFRIDKDDYNLVKDYCWHSKDGYAYAPIRGSDNKQIAMSRLIMDCPDDLNIDHINHDISDNRKCNLRFATDSQNNWNKKESHQSGILYNKTQHLWQIYIHYNLQQIYLGGYEDYEEAQNIKQKAELIFYGDFSYIQSVINNKNINYKMEEKQ